MLGRLVLLRVITFAIGAASIATVASAQDSTASRAPLIAARDTARRITGLRSPIAAGLLGAVVPGAGLAYARDWTGAASTFVRTLGSIGAGSLLLVVDRCTFAFLNDTRCNPGVLWPQHAVGVGFVGYGGWVWATSAIKAVRLVKDFNAIEVQNQRSGLFRFEPAVFPPDSPAGLWAAGIHAAW
jgi:hypothetical protein